MLSKKVYMALSLTHTFTLTPNHLLFIIGNRLAPLDSKVNKLDQAEVDNKNETNKKERS